MKSKKFEYLNDEIEYFIDQCVHSERDRKILKRKLIDGITFEALAEEFHLSVSRVKIIVRDNVNTLSKYIKPS